MRRILFSAAVIVGVVWGSSVPAKATPLVASGLVSPNVETTSVEEVGWRRQYRRYGYPVPYAYYPSRLWLLCASPGVRLLSTRVWLLSASGRRLFVCGCQLR